MMVLEITLIREKTRLRAKTYGYSIPPERPLLMLANEFQVKPINEVVNRALSIFGVLAVTFEPKKSFADAQKQVFEWLTRQQLVMALTADERLAFHKDTNQKECERLHWGKQESLYALGWSLTLCSSINPADYLPDDFGNCFPDTVANENRESFGDKCKLQTIEELVAELDFWYCLHWFATESRLQNQVWNKPISVAAIVARRKALEWVLCSDEWDEVSLDT